MDIDTFLYLTSFLIVIGITSFLLIYKKWKCKNGICEQVFGGNYSTLNECKKSKECNTDNSEHVLSTKYDCINNKICVQNDKGLHNTLNECINNCGDNLPQNKYSYGVPYHIYPYGFNYDYGRRFAPRHRSHRHRSHRHRSHKHRSHVQIDI